MKNLRKIIGDVEPTKDLLFLLLIGGLYSLSVALSNTFVNIYLWKQSGEFADLGLYNLSVVVFQPLTFILAGRWAKKIDRVIVLRLGVIFLSLFYLAVLVTGSDASEHLILLGGLLGVGYGFYWLAYNVLTFEITEPETRDFFNGFLGGLESLGGMIGPIFAGFLITKLKTEIGYTTIFSISLSLFVLAVICSFFLDRRKAEGKFDLKKVFAEVKRNDNWRNTVLANIFQGMRDGIFVFVVTIWVFLVTKSEFALGIINFTLSFMSLFFYLVVTKEMKQHLRKKAIFLGSFVISFSVFIILFELTFVHLLIYSFIIGIAYPIINVPFNSMTYDIIGTSTDARELRIEYVVGLEICVNVGRVISLIIFILTISIFPTNESIPILLAIFSQAYLFIYVFMKRVRLTI